MRVFSNRCELKYVLDCQTYYRIKKEIAPLFRQDPSGGKTGKYKVISLYYDTPNLDFFWEKKDGEGQRVKVRLRTYVHDFQISNAGIKNDVFLEIKKKKNKTVFKKRVLMEEQKARLFLKHPHLEKYFLNGVDNKGVAALKEAGYLRSLLQLEPKLVISYLREPFVSRDNLNVRITFDSNVRYRSKDLSLTAKNTDKRVLSPNHVIMEIKYTDYFPLWLVHVIQRNKCEAQTFSKYGIGMEHFLGEQKMLLNGGMNYGLVY